MCLDEMRPQAVKSYPGKQLVYPEAAETKPAGRAKQAIDYGRRGKAGYVFGAMTPTDGEVFTATYPHRKLVNWIDFLPHVEEWIPKDVERVYAVLDNLTMHRAMDVLFFNLAYPRLRVRLSAHCCGVFEPDRAVVEDAEARWPSKDDASRAGSKSRRQCEICDSLLECAQASLCVGTAQAPSSSQKTWHCASATGGMNLADAPLSGSICN